MGNTNKRFRTNSLAMGNTNKRQKTSNEDVVISPELPEDMVIEILLRLPVKSLKRFKSICKSWRDLIGSPEFIYLHLLQSKSHRPLKLYINLASFTVSKDGSHVDVPWPKTLLEDHKAMMKVPVVASCNGLICMQILEANYLVWNPATRQYKVLTNAEYGINDEQMLRDKVQVLPGFGYVPSIKNYKLAEIVFRHDSSILVRLFTLGTKSFKRLFPKITGIRPYNAPFAYPVTTNGFVHFVARDENENPNFLVSFDLENEKLAKSLMPYSPYLDTKRLLTTTMEEDLAMFVFPESRPHAFLDIWVLDKDNNNGGRHPILGSWNKRASIGPSLGIDGRVARSFWFDGDIVFHPIKVEPDDDPLLCEVKDNYLGKVKEFPGKSKRSYLYTNYVESLVTVDGAYTSKKRKRSWFRIRI